jgi:L-ascorbate metabolism protein UlaG (beta-lactamase superfamily)
MAIRLTWLGHASWLIETASDRIILDPFLTGNPAAKCRPSDLGKVTHVLVSHAHHDHVADVHNFTASGEATLIANFEITQWFERHHGVKRSVGMNTGGKVAIASGEILMTPAFHSSSFSDGSYGGCPGGFVLKASGKRIYFACDTGFFSDMAHYALGADLAVLPIGDLFTMGIDESIRAIRTIRPAKALPTHYGTWPPIEQDPHAWADKVRAESDAEPIVLKVGESISL